MIVVMGVHMRPGYFSDVTSAILQSSANVTHLWIVGSPYLKMFRELTLQLKARVVHVTQCTQTHTCTLSQVQVTWT
jgi:hypothetical protein